MTEKELTQKAHNMMTAARGRLMLDHTYYGHRAGKLELKPTLGIGTAATDGRHLFYEPRYIASLTLSQLVFLNAHEVAHVDFCHHTRRGGRDKTIWNNAGDYVINSELVKHNIGHMPPGGLHDLQYAGMSTEQVYNLLMDQERDDTDQDQGDQDQDDGDETSDQNQQPSNNDQDDTSEDPAAVYGTCGGVMDTPPDIDPNEAEAKTKQDISQAVNAAAMAGNMPSGLERRVSEIIAPRADYRDMLQDFVGRVTDNDYSYLRPSHASDEFLLPGEYSEGVGLVIVAVDTSGSITGPVIDQFCADIIGLRDQYKFDMIIIYCDSTIHRIDRFNADDPVTFSPVGGGGTSFVPVFDHVRDALSFEDIAGLIYLTDLEGWFPDQAPVFPVLWLNYGHRDRVAPFGSVAKMTKD